MNVDEVNYDLVLTPTGHLLLRETEESGDPDAWMKRAVTAFSSSQAAGLFSLAASRILSCFITTFLLSIDYNNPNCKPK